MDYDKVLKQFRKKKIAEPDTMPVQFSYDKKDISKIIPHRDPFMLIDKLTSLDLENEIIAGQCYINPDLPLFKGHFPEFPVYPGCLEVEMTGQLGLCMYYFISNNTTEIKDGFSIPNIRATRVLGAYYLAPVTPGETVEIIAKKLDGDDFFAKVIGQVIINGTVACAAISEVCFLD